jgi:hypothetical protein
MFRKHTALDPLKKPVLIFYIISFPRVNIKFDPFPKEPRPQFNFFTKIIPVVLTATEKGKNKMTLSEISVPKISNRKIGEKDNHNKDCNKDETGGPGIQETSNHGSRNGH